MLVEIEAELEVVVEKVELFELLGIEFVDYEVEIEFYLEEELRCLVQEVAVAAGSLFQVALKDYNIE